MYKNRRYIPRWRALKRKKGKRKTKDKENNGGILEEGSSRQKGEAMR
jgi:hypothetical protein